MRPRIAPIERMKEPKQIKVSNGLSLIAKQACVFERFQSAVIRAIRRRRSG
jgi:hypothetical protein